MILQLVCVGFHRVFFGNNADGFILMLVMAARKYTYEARLHGCGPFKHGSEQQWGFLLEIVLGRGGLLDAMGITLI